MKKLFLNAVTLLVLLFTVNTCLQAATVKKPLVAKKLTVSLAEDCNNCFSKRYIYFAGNISRYPYTTDATYQSLTALIDRGVKAGYNGIVYNAAGNGNFASQLTPNKLKDFDANNIALANYAANAGMELIPVGLNPESITLVDPSMVEALPVKNSQLIVNNGIALPAQTNIIPNSDFENDLSGWQLFDGITIDQNIGHSGTKSVVLDAKNNTSVMRLFRELAVNKFTTYRLSFWIKTDKFDAPLTLQIYDKQTANPVYRNQTYGLGQSTINGQLSSTGNIVASTQEWKQYSVDFNTTTNDTVRIYLGIWRLAVLRGQAWIDDVQINEVTLARTVNRASTPIIVTNDSGTVKYKLNEDYIPGIEKLFIPVNSRIQNGDKIRISWQQSSSGMLSSTGPSNACYPNFFDVSKNIYQTTYNLLKKPNGFFIYYDEWRIMNWDKSCGNMDAATYLASTVNRVQQNIYSINPNAEIYIWNDMFDQYHNATPKYWLANGSLGTSWTGLHPNTVIVNWNELGDTAQQNSLKDFSAKSFRQMIAFYYDDPTLVKTDAWLRNLQMVQQSDSVAVEGFMYTTWQGDYSKLEEVANRVRAAYPGRWPAQK